MTRTVSEKVLNRRKLPLGVEDFRTIRGEDYYYVDKTPFIRHLIGGGRRYFLSRPRRFGKSLLLDTLLELFEGNEPLFRGLDIHGHWDWSVRYPVVLLSFGGKYIEPEDLDTTLPNNWVGSREKPVWIQSWHRNSGLLAFGVSCEICTKPAVGLSWCWWTNTTSRSWMCWRTRNWRKPTGTTCVASTE